MHLYLPAPRSLLMAHDQAPAQDQSRPSAALIRTKEEHRMSRRELTPSERNVAGLVAQDSPTRRSPPSSASPSRRPKLHPHQPSRLAGPAPLLAKQGAPCSRSSAMPAALPSPRAASCVTSSKPVLSTTATAPSHVRQRPHHLDVHLRPLPQKGRAGPQHLAAASELTTRPTSARRISPWLIIPRQASPPEPSSPSAPPPRPATDSRSRRR